MSPSPRPGTETDTDATETTAASPRKNNGAEAESAVRSPTEKTPHPAAAEEEQRTNNPWEVMRGVFGNVATVPTMRGWDEVVERTRETMSEARARSLETMEATRAASLELASSATSLGDKISARVKEQFGTQNDDDDDDDGTTPVNHGQEEPPDAASRASVFVAWGFGGGGESKSGASSNLVADKRNGDVENPAADAEEGLEEETPEEEQPAGEERRSLLGSFLPAAESSSTSLGATLKQLSSMRLGEAESTLADFGRTAASSASHFSSDMGRTAAGLARSVGDGGKSLVDKFASSVADTKECGLTRAQRFRYYVVLLVASLFFFGLSLQFLLAPSKFATAFSLGTISSLAAKAMLNGPYTQLRLMLQLRKLPYTLALLGSTVLTLYLTVTRTSIILVLLAAAANVAALLYYLFADTPGGKAGIKLLFKFILNTLRLLAKPFLYAFE